MPAPKKNQFWKLRTKHGRDKLFSSPDELWKAACEYFDWCDKNPLETLEFNGKDVIECTVPKMRAYTWSGLEFYLDISDLKNYKNKEGYEDFFPVITRIDKIIYTQKFEGAAAGLLNANIIARDLGLKDGTDITTKGEKISTPATDLSKLPLELLIEIEKHLTNTTQG